MKTNVQEDFAERVCVIQQDPSSKLRSVYRNPVHFHGNNLHDSDGPLENTEKKEIVVWLLVVVLGVVTLIAFDLLWLKVDRAEGVVGRKSTCPSFDEVIVLRGFN